MRGALLADAVFTDVLQGSSDVGLVVVGEGDGKRPLLVHRISPNNSYQRQGGKSGRCRLARRQRN